MFKFLLYFITCFFLISSCSKNQDRLSHGTFSLYEEGEYVGSIYRLNEYQLEKYGEKYLFAKLNWVSSSSFLLQGLEDNPIGVDTLIFSMKHYKLGLRKYRVEGEAINSNINYIYRAILIKESDTIPLNYEKMILAEKSRLFDKNIQK
mgnify:CR=1 FL=1